MLQDTDMSQPSSGKSFSSSSKLRRACSSEWCFSRKVSWSHSCWSSVLKIHQNSSKCTTAHLSNRDDNKSTNVSPCQILLHWFSNMFNMRNQVSYIFNQVTICSSDIARWRNWPEKVRRIGRGISKPWWCRCNIQKKMQIQKFNFDSLLDINDINLQERKFQFNFSAQMQLNFNRENKKLPSPRHVQSFLFDVERWPLWTWHGRGSARHSAGDYAAFASLRSAPAWNNTTFPTKW